MAIFFAPIVVTLITGIAGKVAYDTYDKHQDGKKRQKMQSNHATNVKALEKRIINLKQEIERHAELIKEANQELKLNTEKLQAMLKELKELQAMRDRDGTSFAGMASASFSSSIFTNKRTEARAKLQAKYDRQIKILEKNVSSLEAELLKIKKKSENAQKKANESKEKAEKLKSVYKKNV